VQASSVIRLAQDVKSFFALAVRRIVQKQQRRIEKHLLSLSHADPMLVVLASIAGIPLKTNDGGQIDHALYITIIYKQAEASLLIRQATPWMKLISMGKSVKTAGVRAFFQA